MMPAAPGQPRTLTVAGGNLFRIALAEYGDALAWTRIAEANGMTDPWITGVATLIVPRRDQGVTQGGILGAV